MLYLVGADTAFRILGAKGDLDDTPLAVFNLSPIRPGTYRNPTFVHELLLYLMMF